MRDTMQHFNTLVCGGTFDHFHTGHREFLHSILSSSSKILLGLTDDPYVLNKGLHDLIEPYDVRKQTLEVFFKELDALSRVEIRSIDSLYIPVQWQKISIDAIAVTDETREGAVQINEQRKRQGLPPLFVRAFPMVKAKDGGFISSFRIRNGEINREGEPYIKKEWLTKSHCLPAFLRGQLQKPFGKIVATEQLTSNLLGKKNIVTVGDVVTKTCNELGIRQQVSVVDFLVQRKKIYNTLKDLDFRGSPIEIKIENSASNISKEMFEQIVSIIKKNRTPKDQVVLQIEGEEDLAVLPFLLVLPLGWVILYGQPKKGIVLVEVSEQKKDEDYTILEKFDECE